MTPELPSSLLMFIASRAAADRIFRAVHEAGFDDVTIAQSRLLMGLDPDGTRLSVLADRAQIAKQTATALVDKLERAGYVERVPDPSDGRARLVRMTARALAVVPIARAEEDRIEAEWRAQLGPELMGRLREALTALRDTTDPYRQDTSRDLRRTAARRAPPPDLGQARRGHLPPDDNEVEACRT